MPGFIYIFSNPLYSRIKIGKSKRVPTEGRLSELSGGTETPEPFECEYYAFVGDEDGLERAIHRLFDNKRPNKYREYFDMSVTEAINGIRSLADQYGGVKSEEIFHKNIQKQNYKFGDFYEGELKQGKRNGYGTYSWVSGQKYIGDWKDGKKHGQGTLIFESGNKYDGEWKDNEKNGYGTYSWASGQKYIGDWKDGKKKGQGTLIFESGNKYDGDWKDHEKNGYGTYTWASGQKYIGDWKDGKMNGQGTMSYSDGYHYDGEWKDELRHGNGTLTGPVKDENYISQLFVGKGTKWIGTWSNDKMHGKFKVVFPAGSKRTETYKHGKETTSVFKRMLR